MSSLPRIEQQSYGKSRVRVSRIERLADRQEFIELSVGIELAGDFDAAYTSADNTLVVPTDTMKNTIYVLAARHGVPSIEAFAVRLGEHFLGAYGHVDRVEVRCEEQPWTRLTQAGQPHPHAFAGGTSQRHTCRLTATRQATKLESGFTGLRVLKTTESGFAGYLRDSYTTLAETDDRILATSITATWPCHELAADWSAHRAAIRAAMVDVFANRYSPSVQSTLYDMARAALDVCPVIDRITINLPNQHHLPVSLGNLGVSNPNLVFVPTDEPHGNITATVVRGAAGVAG